MRSLFRRAPAPEPSPPRTRGPATHVVILDGTMSSLSDGCETHAGRLYKLLLEAGARENLTVYYEQGIQWTNWRGTVGVMKGRGINRQIKRAYGALASRYRPGDEIVLAGYSRGAYAVRSLAGVIDMVGLIRPDQATERNVQLAYRHYRRGGKGPAAAAFRRKMCHSEVEIAAVAVWDTVKALGLRLPVIWRWSKEDHTFHNHALGASVRNGFHALAVDETRVAYAPVMWACPPDWAGHMEQVWFPGTHGDVGGQLEGYEPARPMANLSMVWMLQRLSACGLPLPDGAIARFETDPHAPSTGKWRGWAKLFLTRRARPVGVCRSERVHDSVSIRRAGQPTGAGQATRA
nr:DUF2235 domain-containing protein [Pseudooctadecabacter jejudonensis]